MSEKETFCERLERIMKEKKILQKELAEKAGISTNGISTWKVTGVIPRADVAVKIAAVLGVTVEYLVTGEVPGVDGNDELAYSVSCLSAEKRSVVQAVVDSLKVFD